ncbi:hypothetical protein [Pseudalkalibacillus salsuginis]|nr:hypothetical protein [Pseudalkalibacillus salsuginis]MCF6412061.1 hypothetical protein [Pseudalkalibacillus salsuginis]
MELLMSSHPDIQFKGRKKGQIMLRKLRDQIKQNWRDLFGIKQRVPNF